MMPRTIVLSVCLAACSAAPAREQEGAAGSGGAPTAPAATVSQARAPEPDGQPCTADAECASASCNAVVAACRASRDATCDDAIGCTGGLVCARDCPLPACGPPHCREVVRNVTCASDVDCKKGAFCDVDHLCKWPHGGRCDWSVAWCADGEICCPKPKGARCVAREACKG